MVLQPLFWAAVLIILAITGLAYGVFFWSAVQVQAIEIQGENTGDIEQIAWQAVNETWLFLPWSNILLVNTAHIEQSIINQFPEIETVTIEKKFFNKLVVIPQKRTLAGYYCATENCFLVDRLGVAYGPKTTESAKMPTITMTENPNPELGETLIEPQMMASIISITKNLQDKFAVQVTQATIGESLVIDTNEHWKMHFNPRNDINGQVMKMNALFEKEIKPADRKKLQYIYLQYKDRAYYK